MGDFRAEFFRAVAVTMFAALVGACGTSSVLDAKSSGRSAPETSSPAGARPATAEAPATERSGLGTAWGESRWSPVHDAPFDRADVEHPTAVLTVHYNDRQGADRVPGYDGRAHRGLSMAGGAVTVAIRDDSGASLPTFFSGARPMVVGREGARYTIDLENRSGRRFEVVATVDGIDVIAGTSGSIRHRGYLISPYGSLHIDGFRRSQNETAAFRFSTVADSYAADLGDARDVGVIGLALFSERGSAIDPYEEDRLRSTAEAFPHDSRRYAKPPRGR